MEIAKEIPAPTEEGLLPGNSEETPIPCLLLYPTGIG